MAVGCRFPVRAEFADSLEHPDPVPLAVLPRRDVTPATPADSNAGSGCRQHVGCASPGRTQGENRCRRPGSPTRSVQSTHRVNPEAPGWTKRLHLGSAPPDRTPCPYRMSALEQSIRNRARSPVLRWTSTRRQRRKRIGIRRGRMRRTRIRRERSNCYNEEKAITGLSQQKVGAGDDDDDALLILDLPAYSHFSKGSFLWQPRDRKTVSSQDLLSNKETGLQSSCH
ncbi:uncharacterized protein LOC119335268 isoform X2 [Triticum dicoccoides]|uniref:uncharacterized protein LOC119335268 isoform X2 n=1 Tax=Triticum dicoccoides TaxID=85692 RepID=UPI0018915C3C|nr:uncharacterized protein LOC119335268 isoform X2 [Triticum dicoccoides]